MPLVWILLTSFKSPQDSIATRRSRVPAVDRPGYVNLFTTRSRQTPEQYIAACRRADDLVEQIAREQQHGRGRAARASPPLHQLAGHRLRLDLPVGGPGHAGRLRLLALQGAGQGRPAVLHPVHADDAADRGGDPHLPDVPRARPVGHPPRHDPALHGGQRLARGLAAQGLHRRDPARVRGGGAWSTATRACRRSARWCCRKRPPASRRPRSSA